MNYIIEVFQTIKRWDDEVSKALMLLSSYCTVCFSHYMIDKLNKIIYDIGYYMPGTGLNPITKKLKLVVLDGEGDGTPLQFSCLENPMDGGAW